MRTVVQRVTEASVKVPAEGYESRIGHGLLVLAAFIDEDTEEDLDWMSRKIAAMRIFDDADGVMNLSVKDVDGEVLIVSQFTLYASTVKGNRPSYVRAARPDVAIPLYEKFLKKLEEHLLDEMQRISYLPNEGRIELSCKNLDRIASALVLTVVPLALMCPPPPYLTAT